MRGTAASRAVLVLVGVFAVLVAMTAGIKPLMNIVGIADQKGDIDRLEKIEEAVREKCSQAKNGAANFDTKFDVQLENVERIESDSDSEGEYLRATFESSDSWISQSFQCSLNPVQGSNSYIPGDDWNINVTSTGSQSNPEITVEATPP